MILAPLSPKDRRKALEWVEAAVADDLSEDPDWGASFLRNLRRLVLESPEAGLTVGDDNSKLGRGVMSFTLPPGNVFRRGTCPGANELCETICYASRGRMKLSEWRYWMNLAIVELWPARFLEALTENPLSKVFRVHVGGDFHSKAYLELWERVIQENPRTRFYAYTRSWQDGRGGPSPLEGALGRLAAMKNMRLLLSCDRLTGVPDLGRVPGAVRAWLMENDQDEPPVPVEVVFRERPQTVRAQAGGSPICPIERTNQAAKVAGKITCRNCLWCVDAAHAAVGVREGTLSKFSGFSGWDMPVRVRGMFRRFVPEGAALGSGGGAVGVCGCGLDALCGLCGGCVECRCVCG